MILWYIEFGIEKHSDCFTGFELILWYTGFGLEKHLVLLTGIRLILYIKPGLIELIKQTGMPLEKYEDFLELTTKELVMQSRPLSLGQLMCGVWKTKC